MAIRKSRKKAAMKKRPAAPARKKTFSKSARPIGLDLGTSTPARTRPRNEHVVAVRPNGRGVRTSSELNAFIELPKSRFTEQILDQNRIDFVRENGHLVVYGNGAFKFANMFNAETRRPMRHGLVNAASPMRRDFSKSSSRSSSESRKQKAGFFASAFRGHLKKHLRASSITKLS